MYTGTRLTTAIHRSLLSRFFLTEGGHLYTEWILPVCLESRFPANSGLSLLVVMDSETSASREESRPPNTRQKEATVLLSLERCNKRKQNVAKANFILFCNDADTQSLSGSINFSRIGEIYFNSRDFDGFWPGFVLQAVVKFRSGEPSDPCLKGQKS